MTIREIQTRTGLDRATVYYYEREGLISPARQANGYRDYSDADLTALRRIRLLRQLGLSLEQLRAVQAGAEALPDILAGRLAELERQQTDNARALAVCRAIRETGVAFDQLDPDAFGLAAGPAVRDVPRPARCGARRALARALDAALCTLPVTALLTLALHRNPLREWPLFLAAELAGVLLLTRLLEPWLLGRFGATPGKALLGLRVEDAGGGTLTGAQAAGRTGQLLRFWRWPRALRQYRKAGLCPWDEAGSLLLTARPAKAWRCGAAALALAVWLAATGALGIMAGFPPHTGLLTAREFMENYNFYARFEGFPEDHLVPWDDLDEPTGRHLLSLGNRRGAVGEYATIALSGDPVVDNVYLLWVWEGEGFQVSWPLREMQRIARALAAGEGGWAALWRLPELDATLAEQPPFAEFETDWGSLRLGASVNADGYTLRDGQLVYTGGVYFPTVFFSFMVWKG